MDKKSLVILIILIILVAGLLVWENYQSQNKKVVIVTDKNQYEKEEPLRVKIENQLTRNICFSSCYPYYLEKKNGEWNSYSYRDCEKSDIIEKCVNLGEIKAFEIPIFYAEAGAHRIVIPICQNCKNGKNFREEKRLYSNEFNIK